MYFTRSEMRGMSFNRVCLRRVMRLESQCKHVRLIVFDLRRLHYNNAEEIGCR